jgi:general secretion pathway protein I
VLQSAQVGSGPVVTPGQIELYQIELIVNWGNQYLMHHARFVTLRAMGPPRNGQVALPGFGG